MAVPCLALPNLHLARTHARARTLGLLCVCIAHHFSTLNSTLLGQILRRPQLGETLQKIATNGSEVFYTGEIAEGIVRTVANNSFFPGIMTMVRAQQQPVSVTCGAVAAGARALMLTVSRS